MRSMHWLVMGLLLAGMVGAGLAVVLSSAGEAGAAPPLSIEHLLDEELPEAPQEVEEVRVDNSACYVCHGNYEVESMVVVHARDKVGCIDCHGPSYDHRNDEDNITPPDKMYTEAEIAENCGKCHDTHDAPADKVIALWQERCPAKTDPKTLVCTDCHGEHRLKFRTVWWNKKTGELIIRKEGEFVKRAEDLTKVPEAESEAAGGEMQ